MLHTGNLLRTKTLRNLMEYCSSTDYVKNMKIIITVIIDSHILHIQILSYFKRFFSGQSNHPSVPGYMSYGKRPGVTPNAKVI